MIQVPDQLLSRIKKVIKSRAQRGEEGWEHSEYEEDSLVGDFLGNLRTRTHKTVIEEQVYEWRILYKKFRGRGKGAYEKIIGADAIITYEVANLTTGDKTIKSIIFQAKKLNNVEGLKTQQNKMTRVAPAGNFVLICTPNGYFTEQKGVEQRKRIGDFLADDFLACHTGIEGMAFDPLKKELRYGIQNIVHVELEHRLTIDIKSYGTERNKRQQ
jgi:hypothetical protein